MKRFLHIINLGSSAMNFIGNQLSYMHEHGGYEMHLICNPCDGMEDFAKKQGAFYYPIDIERQIRIWKDINALWKIYRYMRKHHIDIVVGHQAKGTMLAMTAGWLARVPHRVILAHGMLSETMTGIKKRIFVTEGKIVSRLAHKIVCVSPSIAKRRMEEGIDFPGKQVVLGKGTCNGVDTLYIFNPSFVTIEDRKALKKDLGIQETDTVIGFVGRIVRDKGIIELATAFQILLNSHPEKNAKLLIIGNLERRDGVPEIIVNFLRNSPNVIFTGHVPHNSIQKYYTLMDMLVLPSYREGFPTVILEASAMEVPVIVSRSTGCIDSIIENNTGIYCNIIPKSIVSAIERLFDREVAQELGRNGRKWVVENFEHTIVRKEFLAFYNSLLINKQY